MTYQLTDYVVLDKEKEREREFLVDRPDHAFSEPSRCPLSHSSTLSTRYVRESPPLSGGGRRHDGATGVQQLAESGNVALTQALVHAFSNFKELIKERTRG